MSGGLGGLAVGTRRRQRQHRAGHERARRQRRVRRDDRSVGGGVETQPQGEGAALVHGALDADLAAQRAGQLAADRQAQPGAAVGAAGGAIGLLEGLEDDRQLVLGDADAGIDDAEGHDVLAGPLDAQRHPALRGELERVGQQVAQDLLEALLVSDDGRRHVVQNERIQIEPAAIGKVARVERVAVERFVGTQPGQHIGVRRGQAPALLAH
jgi:hypothetical protein